MDDDLVQPSETGPPEPPDPPPVEPTPPPEPPPEPIETGIEIKGPPRDPDTERR